MAQKSGKGAIIVLTEIYVRTEPCFRVEIYFVQTGKGVQQIQNQEIMFPETTGKCIQKPFFDKAEKQNKGVGFWLEKPKNQHLTIIYASPAHFQNKKD